MDFFGTALFGSAPGVRTRAPGFIEGVVSDLLQPVLGAFVRGFDRDHLELSMWDGDVRLTGLELRTEALNALPIPMRVIGGSLGEVRVSIPWRSLISGDGIEIHIDRVLLMVAPRSSDEPDEDASSGEGKRAVAEAVEAVEATEEQREQIGLSLTDQLIQRLVQKVQVHISNVHVRMQEDVAGGVAGGVTLRSLVLEDLPAEDGRRPPSSKAEIERDAMLSRKRVRLSGLAVYLDTAAATASAFAEVAATATCTITHTQTNAYASSLRLMHAQASSDSRRSHASLCTSPIHGGW